MAGPSILRLTTSSFLKRTGGDVSKRWADDTSATGEMSRMGTTTTTMSASSTFFYQTARDDSPSRGGDQFNSGGGRTMELLAVGEERTSPSKKHSSVMSKSESRLAPIREICADVSYERGTPERKISSSSKYLTPPVRRSSKRLGLSEEKRERLQYKDFDRYEFWRRAMGERAAGVLPCPEKYPWEACFIKGRTFSSGFHGGR